MKETGIIFSAPMVLATLAGVKDVTRRTRGLDEINADPDAWRFDRMIFRRGRWHAIFVRTDSMTVWVPSPYGGPGDLLYGRETHWRYGKWVKDGVTQTSRQRWRFQDIDEGVLFESQPKIDREQAGWHKRPGIFLPKKLARIWRKITGMGAERLHEITTVDAIREGIPSTSGEAISLFGKKMVSNRVHHFWDNSITIENYAWLWDTLNGPGAWEKNEFVWRIESVEYKR